MSGPDARDGCCANQDAIVAYGRWGRTQDAWDGAELRPHGMRMDVATELRTRGTHGTQRRRRWHQDARQTHQTQLVFLLMFILLWAG